MASQGLGLGQLELRWSGGRNLLHQGLPSSWAPPTTILARTVDSGLN